ncbi:AraC family transcriptional regulator [Neobacillus piezotolerans]|uniref:AraC family transcriptional regulator n=1 Tax=Neobacillus piezotolerans TaxID=2259171 RepID=A0A3D8GSQ6_9BACI|nr:AraC family transcriptional regulator [Neobacillus piezotolerans]RDU37342.1 AraC family transcriptional regulator [Neobacillus piezotolerans]
MAKEHSTNFVLHAKSNQFHWEGTGQLSIKTFSNGKALYKTNKGFFAVEENRYLLLNEGEYTISIDQKEEVESFCIFFRDGFAGEVLRTMSSSSNALLTDPFKDSDSIGFFEKTYNATTSLSARLTAFKKNLAVLKEDPLGYEEQFHMFMQSLLYTQLDTLKEIESLNAVRSSTREELYRRISIANDYIRSFFDTAISLDDIARISCMSANHLLRTYIQLFGKTPYQHISELRLEKAKRLLKNPGLSITDITFELGFSNPVSFSKMFRQHEGLSPNQYRKKVILDKN